MLYFSHRDFLFVSYKKAKKILLLLFRYKNVDKNLLTWVRVNPL